MCNSVVRQSTIDTYLQFYQFDKTSLKFSCTRQELTEKFSLAIKSLMVWLIPSKSPDKFIYYDANCANYFIFCMGILQEIIFVFIFILLNK